MIFFFVVAKIFTLPTWTLYMAIFYNHVSTIDTRNGE